MPLFEPDGGLLASTASGPASEPLKKLPPRSSAPGSPVLAAPAMHWSSPVGLRLGLYLSRSWRYFHGLIGQ